MSGLSSYPPHETWHDVVSLDAKAWPRRVEHHHTLVPTTCFNCEAACGLLCHVNHATGRIDRIEGNPLHPASRGRNCAKGPATLNQIEDHERILHPLRRAGERGSGRWERVGWDEALDDIGGRIRAALAEGRHNEVMYHVGRPGEDGYAERVLRCWGVDGHNSHTNICSSNARVGYQSWMGHDRPSADFANAEVIFLISSHLESGHYFNPHAQRIVEAQSRGATVVCVDPRLSNTGAKADFWLPAWPGTEPFLLLAIARLLLANDTWERDFVRRWTNWETYLRERHPHRPAEFDSLRPALLDDYAAHTPEEAERVCGVPAAQLREIAGIIGAHPTKLASHNWRAAAAGNLGGWQTARCLFFLNVLTGSVGTVGGTTGNGWNKYKAPHPPGASAVQHWNELSWPREYPLAHHEMSILLPHFLAEGRGRLEVYFSRVYNPVWTNPDGFSWLEALQDHDKVACHVALTPTWSETALFADYVLPMGVGAERHDVASFETHAGRWIGFRQPVLRRYAEIHSAKPTPAVPVPGAGGRAGTGVQSGLGALARHDAAGAGGGGVSAEGRAGTGAGVGPESRTHEFNPGEVWEENEFWIDLSWRIDPDGSMGIRRWFESPARPGAPISVDEYYSIMFEGVPGLPAEAAAAGKTPLEFMRDRGAYALAGDTHLLYEREVDPAALEGCEMDDSGVFRRQGTPGSWSGEPGELAGLRLSGLGDGSPAVQVDGTPREGFPTPSRKLELYSETLADWGWPEYATPAWIPSHVHWETLDLGGDERILLPTFRIPTLIHTRSANSKWLAELSHRHPLWIHPSDAEALGIEVNGLVRVSTRIGHFVIGAWRTEGIRPGVVAASHHMGRWRLDPSTGGAWAGGDADVSSDGTLWRLRRRGRPESHASADDDTERIWWSDAGVHQNLAFCVQPDPVSGMQCWHQRVRVGPARPGDAHGDVVVDTAKAREAYREWLAMTRPAPGPNGLRRPLWYSRPLKPTPSAYKV